MSDSQRYPLKLCLIKNAWDIHHLLSKFEYFQMRFLYNDGGNCHTSTLIKLENEGLKDTVVNRVSPSLVVRPLEITMTVPLEVKPFDFALFKIYKRLREWVQPKSVFTSVKYIIMKDFFIKNKKMFENVDQQKCYDNVKILNCYRSSAETRE